jgi:hypothetical protein
VGISVHTGNALRGYAVGKMARAAARGWCMAGFTPRCFPKRRWSAAKAHAVVKGDGDMCLGQGGDRLPGGQAGEGV